MLDRFFKLAFVHIPKTAGRSIEIVLGHPRLENDEPPIHAPAGAYEPLIRHGFKFFCVFRNPWDRLVSLNHMVTGDGKVQPMGSFLDSLDGKTGPMSQASQAWWWDPVVLGIEPHGRVLNFETLDEEWEDLLEWAGLQYRPLPHCNKGPKRLPSYRDYYQGDEADRVAELCWWEIREFRYEF